MSKPILIIGPAGSGKTRKMEEITKGKIKTVQRVDQPYITTDHPVDYMVFEEVAPVALALIVPTLSTLLKYRTTLDEEIEKASPTFIIITQCPPHLVPNFYNSRNFEIINFHPKQPE